MRCFLSKKRYIRLRGMSRTNDILFERFRVSEGTDERDGKEGYFRPWGDSF